ncbi:hypothetical protein BGZ80_002463 [Entomortierella chlamydospora]|uniref:Uncharacterized protein n=1 Tax=Entomortierella chlamydospora TaxID=101097 RepID=A0A9P6T392_9FUNG|nr:hypothetical protein BGZ79_006967 [Entomortierella chlamydospora]KAG0021406.1 hypothetical protein BGZ80_002463 [Entomortierella chlamydospora]
MQSSAPIAASQVAPSAPRAQRPNNRKSGITTALQKQSQHQSHSRANNNNCSNGPRQVQRSPEQAHSRRQSMPAQQRGNFNNQNKNDMSNVTILKRSSAAPVPKGTAQIQALQQQQPLNQQLQNFQQQQHQQHRNNYQNQKPKPQFQQQQIPSKTRRVQKRREIESQAQADLDLAMHQSPPLDPSSPPSSSDSDDSESTLSRLPDNVLNTRRHRQMAGNPPQRPNSAPVQSRQGYQNIDIQRSSPKASSADKVMLAEKKSTLYAGPTFHNAPPPTSLPIPAFARSPANTPAEPTVERLPSTPFFAEAASPQLNSMRPQMAQQQPTGWTGHHSMPVAHHYNVPERMATSSFTPHAPGQYGVDQLMEISQNLRTLLKIQSQ